MKFWISIFLLLSGLCQHLPAQENQPQKTPQEKTNQPLHTPNPLNLSIDWWAYFEIPPQELKARIESFSKNLEQIIGETPEKNQQTYKNLTTKVISNLNGYLVAKNQPFRKPPPIPPVKASYTVKELVQISRNIRKKEVLLASTKEDFFGRERQLIAGEDRVKTLWLQYQNTEERSEKRFVKGLDLIDFKTSLALAEEKQKRLEKVIETEEQILEQMKNELNIALTRMTGTIEELNQVKEDAENAKKRWTREQQELRQEEVKSIAAFDFTQSSDEGNVLNQMLSQKLTQASIEDAIAHINFLFYSIQLDLIRSLAFPDQVDYSDIEKKTKRWDSTLDKYETNVMEWEISIKRDIQRAEEWLSASIKQQGGEDEGVKSLQRESLELAQKSLVSLISLQNEIEDSRFLISIIQQSIADYRGGLSLFFYSSYEYLKGFWSGWRNWLQKPLITLGKTIITPASILKFIVIVILAFLASRLTSLAINKYAVKGRGIKKSLLFRINRLFQYTIILLGVLIGMAAIGFDFTNLVLIAGALGVGLGFGLQQLFNNFVSGLVLLFENQLQVGDYVELESGVVGEVKEINARSTYIKTNDGIAILVPNSEFTTGRVVNWTMKEPFRRVQIFFSVSYDTDKNLVKKVVADAVKEVALTLKKSWAPEPRVYIDKLGSDGIEFKVMVWVDDSATKRSSYTRSAYLWAIHDALVKNGITVPFPQLDLHLEKESLHHYYKQEKKNE